MHLLTSPKVKQHEILMEVVIESMLTTPPNYCVMALNLNTSNFALTYVRVLGIRQIPPLVDNTYLAFL